MQYKTIDEQNKEFIKIIKKNKQLIDVLNFISTLDMQNFYIAAGSIFQTIWNYYYNNDLNYGIKDLDIIYYNPKDLSVEKDLEYYSIINNYVKEKDYNFEIDVSNEVRMHIWKMEHDGKIIVPYQNTEDAISKWIATVHAIGITIKNKKISVYAPYRLSDIFTRTIRPIKYKDNTKELYNRKAKSWQERFENLNFI